jgi:hypothetical protein
LKVDAAGNAYAFSTPASDRVTDERIASGRTLVWLTIRLAPPAKVISASAPANNAFLAARLMSLSSRYGNDVPIVGPETVLPWTNQKTPIRAEEGYFGLRVGSMNGFTFASNLA